MRPLSFPLALAVTLLAARADADWPVLRHDAQRTGASGSSSNITKPIPYFKYYVGGQIEDVGLVTADADGDGKPDVVFVSNGRIIAKRSDNSLIWQTPSIGGLYIAGVADVDGDGHPDIIVPTISGVTVVALATGAIEWTEPSTDLGQIGGLGIADLDGDGLPDFFIESSECGSVPSLNPGFVYSFAGGFANPKVLWPVPDLNRCGGAATTIFDADGAGHQDVVVGTPDELWVLNGSDGTFLGKASGLGYPTYYVNCLAADVDGVSGDELVCFWNYYDGTQGARRVAVMHWDAPTSTFAPLWSFDLGDLDGGNAALAPSYLADVDLDGHLDVIAGGQTADGVWTTYVLDAVTGEQETTILGAPAGSAPMGPGGKSLIFVTQANATQAWSFAKGSAPVMQWSAAQRSTMVAPNLALLRTGQLYEALDVIDLKHDGNLDVLLQSNDGSGVLAAYSATGTVVATQTLPNQTVGLQVWVEPPFDRTYSQALVARSDGYLNPLDDTLAPTNTSATSQGIQFGGYTVASPLIASLDGGAVQTALTTDSRGVLLAIDMNDAGFASPPKVLWQRAGVGTASVVAGLDGGKPALLVAGTNPAGDGTTFVTALHGDGTEIWQTSLAQPLINDLVPADVDADGVPDVVMDLYDNEIQTIHAISGKTGATLWDTSPVNWYGARPIAAADWNGDGHTDVIALIHGLFAFSGVDGSVLAQGPAIFNYLTPVLADVDGDGVDEVTLCGGYEPARTVQHDLTTAVWTGEDDKPYPAGAIAQCSGVPPVLVEGSTLNPSRIKVTPLSGGSAGVSVTRVLAGGGMYADEASAMAAGQTLGTLGDAAVSANLTGAGRPTALVPSSDGYLYGIDPCAIALDFTYNFGSPVAEAVLGDTDGDGLDEILVSTGDGFIYGLKHEAIAPPQWVYDTDPPHGIVDMDVDDITTFSTLYCAWAAVPGAAGYQVSLLGPDGSFQTTPSWQDVDADTTTFTFSGLTLIDGGRYICAARALNAAGKPSPDVLSDGVVVHLSQPMTTTSSQGGGGSTSTSSMGGMGGMPANGGGGMGGSTSSSSSSSSTSSSSATTSASVGVGGAGGGEGGKGPSSTATSGGSRRPFGDVILNGRACTCGVPGSANQDDSSAWLAAGGLALALLSRRPRASRKAREARKG